MTQVPHIGFYPWLIIVILLVILLAGSLGFFADDDSPHGELDENIGCGVVLGVLLAIMLIWGLAEFIAFQISLSS